MLLEGNYTMLHTNLEYRLEVFYTLSLDVVGNYYCNFLTATWMMSIHVTSSNYNVMKSHIFLYEYQALNNMSKIMEFIYFFKFQQSFFYFYWYQVIDNTFIICHYNFHLDPIILDHIPFINQSLNTYTYQYIQVS